MSLPSVANVDGAGDYFIGGPPAACDVRRRPGIARSLQLVADRGREGWYGGEFGAALQRIGKGWFSEADFASDLAEWVETATVSAPIGIMHVTPAPTQGYLTALGLAIAAQLPVPTDAADPAWPHVLIEAARAAGQDRNALLYDGADVRPLLTAEDIAAFRADPLATDQQLLLVRLHRAHLALLRGLCDLHHPANRLRTIPVLGRRCNPLVEAGQELVPLQQLD
jgi:gamma-glutamyltranspeptidase/glutathione hydrolase